MWVAPIVRRYGRFFLFTQGIEVVDSERYRLLDVLFLWCVVKYKRKLIDERGFRCKIDINVATFILK